ncbi:hypothetical protein ACLKA6_001124 [Drosophila palustris]
MNTHFPGCLAADDDSGMSSLPFSGKPGGEISVESKDRVNNGSTCQIWLTPDGHLMARQYASLQGDQHPALHLDNKKEGYERNPTRGSHFSLFVESCPQWNSARSSKERSQAEGAEPPQAGCQRPQHYPTLGRTHSCG